MKKHLASPDLFGSVLASVSRSFYLTIRVLPGPVRRPIGLGYLLARASDTIADSAETAPALRLEGLRAFREALREGGVIPPPHAIVPAMLRDGVPDVAERELLDHLPILLRLYHESALADREEIRRVLGTILRGQELDITRFAMHPPGDFPSLASAGELDDYTYRVAGCVGEFWTRLCFLHLPRYSRTDEATMLPQGIALGKGLQLVNILRDAPEDLAKGRCYLPADELAAVGLTPATLRDHPEAARPLFARWNGVARAHFETAYAYIDAIRPWRLRLACFLPWAIGFKTLALLEKQPPLETPERLKVSRSEVRRLLWRGVHVGMSRTALARFHREITRFST